MMRSSLLLLACLTLALLAADAKADDHSNQWNYDTEDIATTVAISADGEYIVAGSGLHWVDDGNSVYLFNMNMQRIWEYNTGDDVSSVAISSNGEYITAGTRDGKIYLFNKDSSSPLWNYTTNYVEDEDIRNINSVAISANGEYIVAGSDDTHIYFFHKQNSTPLWDHQTNGYVHHVDLSDDGEYIIAGGHATHGHNVQLFQKDSENPLWSFGTEEGNRITALDISADGNYVVVGSHKAYLFSRNSNIPLWDYDVGPGGGDSVESLSISANGQYIAIGERREGNGVLSLLPRDSSIPIWSYDVTPQGQYVARMFISTDAQYIVGLGANGIHIFSKDNNTPKTPLWSHELWPPDSSLWAGGGIAVSANCEFIATGIYNYSSNGNGSVSLLYKTLYRPPLVAAFNWSYTDSDGVNIEMTSIEGSPTNFNAGASTGVDLLYEWGFGDGSTATGLIVSHTYNSAPVDGFNVILTVTDVLGNFDIIEYNVKPAQRDRPDLYASSLSFSNDNPSEGDLVTINATIKLLKMNVTDSFEVIFYIDSISDTTDISTVVVSETSLAWGIENEFEVGTVWRATTGTHTIFLVVDANNAIDESDEKNDLSKVITVSASNLEDENKEDDNSNEGASENDEGTPALSVITTMAAVAVIALRRRPE